MEAKEVMTKQPQCCIADTGLVAVARMMIDSDCGAIPVVGDLETRMPIGVITDRDMVIRAIAVGRNPLELTARDCMTTPAFTVTKDTDLDDCIEMLEERQIRRVLVVDKDGSCCGIIAQADVASHASKRTAGELLRGVSLPTPESKAKTIGEPRT